MGAGVSVLFCNRDPRLWNGGDNVQLANTLVALDKLGYNTSFTSHPQHPLDDFDLVHIFQINFEWARKMVENCLRLNKPYVISAIYYPFEKDNSIPEMRAMVDNAKAVICLSEAEKSEMVANLSCRKDHIKVISNGVDPKIYRSANKNTVKRIMCVGRLDDPQKGYEYAKKASDKLGIPLLWVDPKENKTGPEMADLYQKSEVFVCPSLSERQSLAVLEAAACGTPIVDSIYNRGSGLLKSSIVVDPKDLDALCSAIEAQIGKRNTDKVPTWDDVARQIAGVYKK